MLPDLISGRLMYGFVSLATGIARQNDKTLTILAIKGTNRHSLLPAVPTLAELGLKGFRLGDLVRLVRSCVYTEECCREAR